MSMMTMMMVMTMIDDYIPSLEDEGLMDAWLESKVDTPIKKKKPKRLSDASKSDMTDLVNEYSDTLRKLKHVNISDSDAGKMIRSKMLKNAQAQTRRRIGDVNKMLRDVKESEIKDEIHRDLTEKALRAAVRERTKREAAIFQARQDIKDQKEADKLADEEHDMLMKEWVAARNREAAEESGLNKFATKIQRAVRKSQQKKLDDDIFTSDWIDTELKAQDIKKIAADRGGSYRYTIYKAHRCIEEGGSRTEATKR